MTRMMLLFAFCMLVLGAGACGDDCASVNSDASTTPYGCSGQTPTR